MKGKKRERVGPWSDGELGHAVVWSVRETKDGKRGVMVMT